MAGVQVEWGSVKFVQYPYPSVPYSKPLRITRHGTHFWGVVGGGGCQRGEPSKNEPWCSFSEVVDCGSYQREVILPKMSCGAHFQGLWVVLIAREVNLPKTSHEGHFRGLWVVVVVRER